MFKNVKLSVPKTFIKSKPSVAVENDLEVRRQICVRPCTVLSSRADRSNVLICLAKLLKTYQKGSANSHTVRSWEASRRIISLRVRSVRLERCCL